MRETSFITGRHYGPEDQVIKVRYKKDTQFTEVRFYDEVRMIVGRFFYPGYLKAENVQREVMRNYDSNNYEPSYMAEFEGE